MRLLAILPCWRERRREEYRGRAGCFRRARRALQPESSSPRLNARRFGSGVQEANRRAVRGLDGRA